MSLQSMFELASNPEFKNKVIAAVGKVAVETVEAKEDEVQVNFAKYVLRNIRGFADTIVPIVASYPNIDSSSDDNAIEAAVKKAAYAIAPE